MSEVERNQNDKKQESRFVVQKGEVTFLTPEEVEKRLTNKYKPFGESGKNQTIDEVKKVRLEVPEDVVLPVECEWPEIEMVEAELNIYEIDNDGKFIETEVMIETPILTIDAQEDLQINDIELLPLEPIDINKIKCETPRIVQPHCPNCGDTLMYLMPYGQFLCCNKCDKCFVNNNGEVGQECDDPYTEDDVRNTMKSQFFNYLLKQYPNIEQEKYIAELNFIYGAIWEVAEVTEKIKSEICDIETERFKRITFGSMELSPFRFVKEYSEIAFFLAKEHYLSGKTFEVAVFMKDVMTNFLNCGILDEPHKKMLKREISDTMLDFKSASGTDKISSLRMIPIIKYRKWE